MLGLELDFQRDLELDLARKPELEPGFERELEPELVSWNQDLSQNWSRSGSWSLN